MSADAVRLIVDSLNQPPFELGVNFVTFDNFSNERLLQTLSDVICWISDVDRVDVRLEAADQTAVRLLTSLKILKFRPPSDIEQLEEWRAGLIEGTKASVYPVLAYVFSNVDTLKQRGYLAKFLVKIDVPNELQDTDIVHAQNEVTQLMHAFKEVHSRVTAMSLVTEHVQGIKADLKAMQAENEQITRRIERIQSKVKNIPNIDKILEFAELRRIEAERFQSMESQKADMRPWMFQAEKKIKRLQAALDELKNAEKRIDPSEMMQELEDEMQTNSYLVDEKLAKEIEAKRPVVAELRRVVEGPAMDENSIARLQEEIDRKSSRMRELVEERDRREEGHDDNFSIYRHQTATVERKKAATAQKLQDARNELEQIESQIKDKKKELREKIGGEEVVTSVQFKTFVNKMRIKTNDFKKKRAELDAANAENNILSRTSEILSQRWRELQDRIKHMGGDVTEVSVAVPPLPPRPKTAAPRSNDVSLLKEMVQELSAKHARRTDEVAPLKQTHSEHTAIFNERINAVKTKRKEFERRKAALESGQLTVKEEVDELDARRKKAEERLALLQEKLERARMQKERLDAERSGTAPSMTNELEEAIRAAEMENDELEKRRASEGDGEAARRQRLMWKSLLDIFQIKMHLTEKNNMDQSRPLGDGIMRM